MFTQIIVLSIIFFLEYDEAMANDEEEDYAVLITEKGSESFSTEKLSTDHFLNSDSELELFSNRLF